MAVLSRDNKDEEQGESDAGADPSTDVLPNNNNNHQRKKFSISECCWHALLVSSFICIAITVFGFVLAVSWPVLSWLLYAFGLLGPFLFGLGLIDTHPLTDHVLALFRLIPRELQTDVATLGFVGCLWIARLLVVSFDPILSKLGEILEPYAPPENSWMFRFLVTPVAFVVVVATILAFILVFAGTVVILALLSARKLYISGQKIREIQLERQNAASSESDPTLGWVLVLFFVGVRAILVVGSILIFGHAWFWNSSKHDDPLSFGLALAIGGLGVCFAVAWAQTVVTFSTSRQLFHRGAEPETD